MLTDQSAQYFIAYQQQECNGRGHTRESVRPFFELLGEGRIVYDLHVVAKDGREVIGRVRVDEANRVRQDRRARMVINGSLWLLLRNRENLRNEEERVRLEELLAASRNLLIVYVGIWLLEAVVREGHAKWHRCANTIRRRLKSYLRGILAHSGWPFHTSLLEGINNKIKGIKKIPHGFRDDANFFLKNPGNIPR